MKASLAGILALMTVTLLAACGADSGTVVSKDHHEAYTTMRQQCTAYGSDGFCKAWIPVTDHHPERWSVTIKNDQGEKGTWNVSESEYDAINLGDHYARE